MARKKKELPVLEGVEITGVAAEGNSIARHNDKVVFIPFGAPGDIADIKIDKKKHSFSQGHILNLIKPSNLRVQPRCSHFGTCGGCKWQHLPYSYQLDFKRQQVIDSLKRIAKVPIPEVRSCLGSEKQWEYRNKVEYTFSNKKWLTFEQLESGEEFIDRDGAGFHIPGAFDKVLDIKRCYLHDELGNNLRNFLKEFSKKQGWSLYDLKQQRGFLRTLMIRTFTTGQSLAVISLGEDDIVKIKKLMNAVVAEFPEITSLNYVINTKVNDTINDLAVVTYKGKDYAEEKLGDLTFRISPKSFYQTNSLQAFNLYSVVKEMAGLTGKELVYDLYTGTGTIANFLAPFCRKVVGIEYVEDAIADAKLNSEINGIENTAFFAGDMKDVLNKDFINANGHPEIMIVDPPRAGMHDDVIKVIIDTEPDVIVYVSCNPATQARDISLLGKKYDVVEVQPVDMFPHTHHVENIVKLKLNKFCNMITENDRKQIEERGSDLNEVLNQLKRFETGFPYLKLSNAAGIGSGILHLSPDEETAAIKHWNEYLDNGGKVLKFVPASGAASRMFKSLFGFVDGEMETPKAGSDVDELISRIYDLAFYPSLNIKALELYGENVDTLLSQGRYKDVISAIIHEKGLNYGNLPKGLLDFHSYGEDGVRTPVEEQLVEGALSAKASDGIVRLHFTVSGNHRTLFEEKIKEAVPALEKKFNVKFEISLSEQKPVTDTVAANEDNTPFRDNGKLVFRPGGHGALIKNLNDIDAEVVFIKNIDNVVPDKHREVTLKYKKVLGGVLIETQSHIADFLKALESPAISDSKLREIKSFVENDLKISPVPEDKVNMIEFFKKKLNRPLRVCGMVRNDGEPGGGPYIASNPDGTFSPQILESTQIDMGNEEYKIMMTKATHFNPVDLVCFLKDVNGNKFDLTKHVDPSTGFIASKSYKGKQLKALELPGLWNGAMSDWNTIFVEVPSETFNPVKTVNDLLRPVHQG